MKQHFKVTIHKDEIAGVYCAECEVLGIFTEAETIDALQARVMEIAPEMIELYAKRQSEQFKKTAPKLRFVNDTRLIAGFA